MNAVKLSICLPTYNRASFLKKALGYFVDTYKFPCDYEIVISDNASTDDTRSVVGTFIGQGLPIRYYRRNENIGYEPNLASIFRHARGEYAVYLADDDMLVCEGLAEALHYMDNNIEVTACYAPWFLHDEIKSQDVCTFYDVKQNTKFSKGRFSETLSFIVDEHVFPEVGIYRTSAIRAAWVPRYFAYWAFSHLAHYLDQGAIAFLSKPFYRAITISTLTRDRPQAGNDEALTAWDRYKGGLEYLLHLGARRGTVDLTPERRHHYETQIKRFTLSRMAVAMRLWVEKREYVKAYELYTRLTLNGFSQHPDVLAIRDSLPLMVAVQTLAWLTNAAAEVNRLLLHNVDDRHSLEGLLRELGLRPDIKVEGDIPDLTPEEIERTAVFVPSLQDREVYLARGHAPNLVFAEEDIVQPVAV